MRQLTKDHIAAYLPHGVMVEVLDYQCDYVGKQYDRVVGLHQWDKTGELWSVMTEGGAKPAPDKVRLCLLPLSDLDRRITLNGRTFVPAEWLPKARTSNGTVPSLLRGVSPELLPYNIVKQLQEWHFDTMNLIADGLAVDMNTLIAEL